MALRLQIVACPSPLNKCSPVATPILAPFSLRPHQNHRLPTTTTSTTGIGMKANSSRLDSTGRKTSSIRCYSALTPELKTTLDKVVSSHKVVVFIKGTKEFPQCGFSNTVVQILKSLNVPFETINILENEMLRQGLKEYSSWPTFPQLYIDGDFFGGCDIAVEAYKSGELQEVLEKAICS
ncbi:Monothiol glutaredoxin-S14, chloroplastic [Sesamum angolense]|uniref:Monothiol glutaredoxin-S14, chloroplastic n=1 Tax=Sesamum angolense TaxID=2727404 RepID=A0AAE1WG23_9LAMI|nr:Monothiol glutaredoxin-S14, chloroplastic [Sesamum angolense]